MNDQWLDRRGYPLVLGAVLALSTALPSAWGQAKPTFVDDLQPLLREHCSNCHNPDKRKGDLDLTSFQGLLAGSSSGDIITPGDPEDSTLYLGVAHLEEPHMPPKKPKLDAAVLKLIHKWISAGALENSGSTPAPLKKKPKLNLAIDVSAGKPDGPPPMPATLLMEPVTVAHRGSAVTALAHSPWAPLAAVGSHRQVVLYDTNAMKMLGLLPFPEGWPHVVKFSRNGRLLLAAGGRGAKTGTVVLWDITTGNRLAALGDELDAPLAADISADQTIVALGGTDRLVKAYATADGRPLYKIKKHTEWITALAFSADGVLLASGDRNGGMYVWEGASGELFYTLRGHRGSISGLSFRRDSNVLASSSEDGQVYLWNMHNGQRIRNFAAHGGGALDVNFAPNGGLVTAGRDRTVKLWDGNGSAKKTFEAFGDLAVRAVATQDAKKVIGADWNGRIRAWEAATGK
ncbi:MAG: hypothetical protein OER86_08005, partial [Phycisphaerae bacterium]|nr:hypothetical protein [Phycisphaerae bacterium]